MLKSSFLEVFPSFFISLLSFWQWNVPISMCWISVAAPALKTNPFLQGHLPTSVSPHGLQFKNAFCNYNSWHICELLNSCFSFSLLTKIKCCLLNCKSFNFWPWCFGWFVICMSSVPPFNLWVKTDFHWILLLTLKSSPWALGFLNLLLILSETSSWNIF